MLRGTREVFALAGIGALTALFELFGGAACGLTADFSGIQGGTAGTPTVDGSTFDSGDNLLDASPDAGLDAGDEDQASSDDGAPKPFCASLPTAPKLCADFDEGQPVSAGWTLIDTSDGQNVGLDPLAYSKPSSFGSVLLPVGSPASSRLQESLPLLATKVHIEFRMLVTPVAGSFELCALHQDTPQGVVYGVFYKLVDQLIFVQIRNIDASGNETNIGHTLTAPTDWMKVDIDIDVGNPGNVIVKHDDVIVVNELGIPTSTPDRTKLFVELGFYSQNKASIKANFDNVIIDWP